MSYHKTCNYHENQRVIRGSLLGSKLPLVYDWGARAFLMVRATEYYPHPFCCVLLLLGSSICFGWRCAWLRGVFIAASYNALWGVVYCSVGTCSTCGVLMLCRALYGIYLCSCVCWSVCAVVLVLWVGIVLSLLAWLGVLWSVVLVLWVGAPCHQRWGICQMIFPSLVVRCLTSFLNVRT